VSVSHKRIKVFDKSGNEITPKRMTRAAHYDRLKGNIRLTHSIDTNPQEIDGIKVANACFIVFRLAAEGGGAFRLESLDGRHHIYEFHHASENPEMLAILKVAYDTKRGRGPFGKLKRITFITDSDLNHHETISNRERTIYGPHFLPEGFTLMYASADTGRELANKLIKHCHAEKDGAFRRTGLSSLEQDPSVIFRYTYYPGLTVKNPIVKGATLTPDTNWRRR